MYNRKLFTAALVAAPALLWGCDSDRGRAERAESAAPEVTTQSEAQVVSQTALPNQEVGGVSVQEGQADLQARQRVMRTRIVEYKIPTLQITEERANLNEMTAQHFAALGIPEQDAQMIVRHREQQGRFSSLDQLSQIQGISQQTVQQLRDIGAVAPPQ